MRFCYLVILFVLVFSSNVFAQDASTTLDHPLWMRYPAISPDGSTIAFEYQGDIYSVPTAGGPEVPAVDVAVVELKFPAAAIGVRIIAESESILYCGV